MTHTSPPPGAQGHPTARRARGGLVVFCTHGLGDPLVAPLMLDYVVRLQREGGFGQVLFFTEEPPGATEPPWADALLREGRILWVPLRYDVKGWQWMQRGHNVLRMLWRTASFVRRHGRSWLVGYLSYGGSYAVLASWLGLGRSMVVCFEPHSRYMADLGIWGGRSLKTRVVGWLERVQMRRCDALVVPTRAVREAVMAHGPRGRVALQAIAIDADAALFDPLARMRLRAEHGMAGDAIVLAYVGKFGGIYHGVGDYLGFLRDVCDADDRVRALIISQPAELDRIRAHPLYPALRHRMVLVPPVPADELHLHLSMADLGVIAIPPTPSQAFRTPVKTAHYWAAGLPIVVPRGVSDDHRIAAEEDVGIVVDDLVGLDARSFADAMNRLLAGDRDVLRRRCIAAARRHRGTPAMVRLLRSLLVGEGPD